MICGSISIRYLEFEAITFERNRRFSQKCIYHTYQICFKQTHDGFIILEWKWFLLEIGRISTYSVFESIRWSFSWNIASGHVSLCLLLKACEVGPLPLLCIFSCICMRACVQLHTHSSVYIGIFAEEKPVAILFSSTKDIISTMKLHKHLGFL